LFSKQNLEIMEKYIVLGGVVVVGLSLAYISYKHHEKKEEKNGKEEKSNFLGLNRNRFIDRRTEAEGHYCLSKGEDSGYFTTSPCRQGDIQVA